MVLRLDFLRWKGDYHSSHCTRVCSIHPQRNPPTSISFQDCSDCKRSLRAWQFGSGTRSHVEGKPFPPHPMISVTFEYSGCGGRNCQSIFVERSIDLPPKTRLAQLKRSWWSCIWNQDSSERNIRLRTMLPFTKEGRELYQSSDMKWIVILRAQLSPISRQIALCQYS